MKSQEAPPHEASVGSRSRAALGSRSDRAKIYRCRSSETDATSALMGEVELYRRWVDGDRHAGRELVLTHWGRLFDFIQSRVGEDRAQDISQATWLVAQASRG